LEGSDNIRSHMSPNAIAMSGAVVQDAVSEVLAV
jgi:hypothetical protein